MADDLSLAAKLAAEARGVTSGLTSTRYTGEGLIDPAAGVFDVDCSEYVTYLIGVVAPRHLTRIPLDPVRGRRLAGDFYAFAHGLSPILRGGWRQIMSLSDAVPGDIVAWQRHDRANDTGHVFVVAATAVIDAASGTASVAVYDSSNVIHGDDSRGPGKPFADGVGTGSIRFRIDADGAADQFQFAPFDHFHPAPVAIARIEPFSAT